MIKFLINFLERRERKKLIKLCSKGIISEKYWNSEFSYDIISHLSICRGLLESNCYFEFINNDEFNEDFLSWFDVYSLKIHKIKGMVGIKIFQKNYIQNIDSEEIVDLFFIPSKEIIKNKKWKYNFTQI